MPKILLANDGEVGLVYRKKGKSYAVALTKEQHTLLQSITPCLGVLAVDSSREVDFKTKEERKLNVYDPTL